MTQTTQTVHDDTARGDVGDHQDSARDLLAELGALSEDRPQWHAEALCAQTDPELFYPEQGGSTREAKQICARCPVQPECLAYLLAHDERFGIWAGLSERERRRAIPAARAQRAAATESIEVETREVEVREVEVREVEVPTARTAVSRRRGESAPAPGGGRHAGGTGLAATLPTEPRHSRGRPVTARARSTFPDRARRSDAPDQPPAVRPAPAGPRTATRRKRRAVVATRADAPATDPVPSAPTAAAAEPIDAPADHDIAAGGTAPRRPPDPPRPAQQDSARPLVPGAVAEVLAGQPDAPELDPATITALTEGATAREHLECGSAGEWQLRVAAVAAVISGQATRGHTARRFGLATQEVAHWVARHQQRMRLLEQDEQCSR